MKKKGRQVHDARLRGLARLFSHLCVADVRVKQLVDGLELLRAFEAEVVERLRTQQTEGEECCALVIASNGNQQLRGRLAEKILARPLSTVLSSAGARPVCWKGRKEQQQRMLHLKKRSRGQN